MSVTRYSGDMEDAIANGMKFTTYDADKDMWSGGNCASALGGGGWWYSDCGSSCLTAAGNPTWTIWPATQPRMMIKPTA